MPPTQRDWSLFYTMATSWVTIFAVTRSARDGTKMSCTAALSKGFRCEIYLKASEQLASATFSEVSLELPTCSAGYFGISQLYSNRGWDFLLLAEILHTIRLF